MNWILKPLVIITIFCCSDTFTQLPKSVSSEYKLIWQDEFDGHTLDTSKWYYRAAGTMRPFGKPIKENVVLNGKGQLILKITKKDSAYFISQIATKLNNLFQYGYFECRLRVGQSYAPSTAFWMKSPIYGRFPGEPARSGTEVDILEYRRKHRSDQLVNTVHWVDKKGEHTQKSKEYIFKPVEDGFHTYSLEWTPKSYTFYVDGEQKWKTRKAVAQIAQQLILSVELTEWSGDHKRGTYPDSAIYDYVRVWQKNRGL